MPTLAAADQAALPTLEVRRCWVGGRALLVLLVVVAALVVLLREEALASRILAGLYHRLRCFRVHTRTYKANSCTAL